MQTASTNDVLGTILSAYAATGAPTDELYIVRDDGFTTSTSLEHWVRPTTIAEFELSVLSKVRGKTVLDIGCGAGRHLKWLQERGFEAYGVDISAGAIAFAHRIVGDRATAASIWDYAPRRRFDDFIIMDSTIGLIGRIANLYPFLLRLSRWATPGARVLATGLDWRTPKEEAHRAYQEKSTRAYKGEIRMQLRYKDIVSDWFDWVWVDPDTLVDTAWQVGFRVHELARHDHKYAMTLCWKDEGHAHDATEQEWILGRPARPAANLVEVSYGDAPDDSNVRVQQLGPFRVSFEVPADSGMRTSVLEGTDLLRDIGAWLGIAPLVAGSMSPLSPKLPCRQSDRDFYLPVPSTATKADVDALAARLRAFPWGQTGWRPEDFSFVRDWWLKLPSFIDAVNPLSDDDAALWRAGPETLRCEAERRLMNAIAFLQALPLETVVEDFERFFSARFDRARVRRIVATPRWLSLADTVLERLMTITL